MHLLGLGMGLWCPTFRSASTMYAARTKHGFSSWHGFQSRGLSKGLLGTTWLCGSTGGQYRELGCGVCICDLVLRPPRSFQLLLGLPALDLKPGWLQPMTSRWKSFGGRRLLSSVGSQG